MSGDGRGAAPLCCFSDVHLSPAEPLRTARLVRFLGALERDPPRLCACLGDLFDYWVGRGQERLADFGDALDALAALGRAGARLCFVHGNRDFLVGDELVERLGAPTLALHGDLAVLDAGGVPFGVAHGDLLCARDTRYRAMRRVIRSEAARRGFALLPLEARLRTGARMRGMSEREVARKAQGQLSLSPSGVRRFFRRLDALAGSGRVVRAAAVGHVHRARRIGLAVDGVRRSLYTLGAWEREDASWLEIEPGRARLFSGPGGERLLDEAW